MKVVKYLQVALESITAHKLRAILTMLGIIIGVAAVLITMGIGRGAAANITERIESQGTNLVTISPGASNTGGLAGAAGSASTLTMGDVEALMDSDLHPALTLVAPEYGANACLRCCAWASGNKATAGIGVRRAKPTGHSPRSSPAAAVRDEHQLLHQMGARQLSI